MVRFALGDEALEPCVELLGGVARLWVEQVAVALQKEEPHHRRFPSRAGDEGLGQARQPLARGPARRLRLLEHLGRCLPVK